MTMYHVAGTVLTTLILYLISWFLYRNRLISRQIHRKVWNSILAITFLFTALAGLFLALQINYKWETHIIGTIRWWHVEVGAVMTATGIFHFLWHITYYTGLFNKEERTSSAEMPPADNSGDIPANLFTVGFISSAFQLLLIREMMNIAGGYELIAGTFLASWLIASALGAVMAGNSELNSLKKINLIFSLSPVASLILLILLSRLFLRTGEIPSFLGGFIYTLLVLLPFCLLSGFTFVKLISAARQAVNYSPGRSFAVETAGGIAAGIAVVLLSSGIMNTYSMMLILIVSGFAYAIVVFFIRTRAVILTFKAFIGLIMISIILFNPDNFFRSMLLPGISISESRDTPYGNIVRGEYGGEESIYYNHRLLTYSGNTAEREENIHYAMLQSKSPEEILLISGSVSAHIGEIMKYPVREVVYVERDPALARLEKLPASAGSVTLRIENDDAYRFIADTDKSFDVIIMLLPPPSSLLLNKYYTDEFFSSVKKKLRTGGIFMCSPGPAKTYYNEESLKLYSSVYNTLSDLFGNVLPLEGHKLYFAASDGELSPAICALTAERNISNIWVSCDYLSDDLVASRSEEIISLIDPDVARNRATVPVASFYYQSYNLSRSIDEKIPALILILVVFIPPVLLLRRRTLLMYSGAAALAGFEIVVLLVLQLTAGNMYQLTGLIVAGLMAGLACGAGFDIKPLASLSLPLKGLIIILFYLLAGSLIPQIIIIRSGLLVSVILVILIFLPAVATGHLFRVLASAGWQGSENSASAVYGADLAGSAIGFILISGLIVPAFGITVSIYFISGMVIAGFITSFRGSNG